MRWPTTATTAGAPWYYAVQPLLAALLVASVLSAAASSLRRPWPGGERLLAALAAAVALAIVFHAARLRHAPSADGPLYRAARWARDNLGGDARVGTWHAGAIGFLSGRQVVNLDGVVNTVDYFRREQYDQCAYWDRTGLTHLVDVFEAREGSTTVIGGTLPSATFYSGCTQRLELLWSESDARQSRLAQGVPDPARLRAPAMSGRELARRGLRLAAAAGAVSALAAFIGTAALRLTYPFELEWLEGGSLDQVQRILEGRALYTRPSAEYAAFPYPPLFYYAAAASSVLVGPGFTALRLVSLLSSIGSCAVLFALVRRETGGALAGLLAAGLFAATYRAGGFWLDVGRVDSLYLFLVLLAAYQARFGATALAQAAAGGLLCLAFLTKQVAIVPAIALCAHHLIWRRRHFLPLAGAFALGVMAATIALDWASGGWFSWHVYRPHGLLGHRFASFWSRDLLPVLPVAAAGAVLYAALPAAPRRAPLPSRLRGRHGRRSGLLSRMIVGAWLNALLPAYAGLALAFGLAFQRAWDALPAPQSGTRAGWRRRCTPPRPSSWRSCAWNPAAAIPTRADREAGERLLARLASQGGRVLVPSHPYLAARATGRGHAHAMAVGDLLTSAAAPCSTRWTARSGSPCASGGSPPSITNGTWRYEGDLERYYRQVPLDELGDAFWPVAGARTRPRAALHAGARSQLLLRRRRVPSGRTRSAA